MIVLLINQRSYRKCQGGISESKQRKLRRRNRAVDNDDSEVFYIHEDRVKKKKPLNLGRKAVEGVEHCGEIHKKHCKDTPKILNIPEENV